MTPDMVVAAARAWIGTPYRHQGSVLGAGCDCLGLVRGVWRAVCGDEPMPLPPYGPGWRDRRSGELLAAAERWLVRADGSLAAGQVVLFRLAGATDPRHCGIMTSDARFVHAQERLGVVEANLADSWRKRIAAQFWFP